MSENRKIQLETEVVADTSGFQEIKQGAQDMAQSVAQSAKQAGAGLDAGISGSVKRATEATKAASQSVMSWAQFLKREMGPAMKDALEGGATHAEAHTQAIRKIAVAWKEYKAGVQTMPKMPAQVVPDTAPVDAYTAAQKRLLATLEREAVLLTHGRAAWRERQAAMLGVSNEASRFISTIRKSEAAPAATQGGLSAKQTSFAMRQVPAQLTDIVTSLQAGQNPLQVILQQGGQLKDLFGGVGNAARGLSSYLATLFTPMNVAIAAGIAGLGGMVVALSRVETEARSLNTLQAQLSATGRGDLFSTDELKKFVNQLALLPGVSRDVATEVVTELSKVKEIGPGLFRELSKAAVDYAKATGTDVPAAARTLAQAFKDPEKGAKTLDDALGKLTSAQILHIERLSKQNDLVGAQKALMEALSPVIRGLADGAMTPLQKSTDDLGNAWEKAMQRLSQSEGLRAVNALLAKTVDSVSFLINNADKIGGLGNLGTTLIPGALPGAVGTAAGSGLRSAIESAFGSSEPKFEGRGATGSFDAPAGDKSKADREAALKRVLETARGDRSEADRLAELTTKRETYNKALADSVALYGKESEQSKRLRGAVAAVDEQIAAAKKKAAGPVSREADQTRQAALEAELARFRDTLQDERDTLAFHERQLQNQYQAGALSLTEFYERRRKAVQDGANAVIEEMEREKARIAEDRDFFASKGDTSRATQLQGRIDNLSRDQDKTRTRAARDVDLANEAQAESYRQLSDEVTNYRANLLQLQGDEAGAARLRADQAIEQARRLAKRSEGTAAAIPDDEVRRQADLLRQINLVNEARRQSGIVASALALEEGRIAMAQRTGAITSFDALSQVGEARKRVVAQLEEIVRAQEEVARSQPKNYELQIDTARARQELERLKEEIDPLAEKFRGMFTDATGDLFADLVNDPKNSSEALKRWANSLSSELTRDIGRDMATQLFGKGGPLGSLPGAAGDLFGKGAKTLPTPLVDTAPLAGSLSALKTVGADPATESLSRLALASDQAARAMGTGTPTTPITAGDFSRMDRGQQVAAVLPTTGDFTRLDRTAQTQEVDTTQDAAKATEALVGSTRDAAKGFSTATMALSLLATAAGNGNSALSLLPLIIQTIQAAAAANGASSGGSGVGGMIGSIFGGASGASSGAVNMGTATGADLALFYHDGGMVGRDRDVRKAGALKPNEVPAVLMGGPKGTREEVLKADDPRHADNLTPAMRRFFDGLPRYHQGGVVGAKTEYLMPRSTEPARAPAMAGEQQGEDGSLGGRPLIVNVQAVPGMSRDSAQQQGRVIGQGIQRSLARNGR
jgi:hypothetical protein